MFHYGGGFPVSFRKIKRKKDFFSFFQTYPIDKIWEIAYNIANAIAGKVDYDDHGKNRAVF